MLGKQTSFENNKKGEVFLRRVKKDWVESDKKTNYELKIAVVLQSYWVKTLDFSSRIMVRFQDVTQTFKTRLSIDFMFLRVSV